MTGDAPLTVQEEINVVKDPQVLNTPRLAGWIPRAE
jgi:hypothetical protein